jgi:hypothetical protein
MASSTLMEEIRRRFGGGGGGELNASYSDVDVGREQLINPIMNSTGDPIRPQRHVVDIRST